MQRTTPVAQLGTLPLSIDPQSDSVRWWKHRHENSASRNTDKLAEWRSNKKRHNSVVRNMLVLLSAELHRQQDASNELLKPTGSGLRGPMSLPTWKGDDSPRLTPRATLMVSPMVLTPIERTTMPLPPSQPLSAIASASVSQEVPDSLATLHSTSRTGPSPALVVVSTALSAPPGPSPSASRPSLSLSSHQQPSLPRALPKQTDPAAQP